MSNKSDLLDEYEEKFGEPISIPFFLPPDKTEDDFFDQVELCIKENKPFDYEAFGIDYSSDEII